MPRHHNARPVIIRREEVVEGGHHGGAWKIAYADFVTAMMAFFLIMWLINATTEAQRRGIAAYFNPLAMDENSPLPPTQNLLPSPPSPLTGGNQIIANPDPTQKLQANNASDNASATLERDGRDRGRTHAASRYGNLQRDQEVVPRIVPLGEALPRGGRLPPQAAGDAQAGLTHAMSAIHDAVAAGDGRDLGQLKLGLKGDGLHVTIVDADGQPMFDLGGMRPNAHGTHLLEVIAPYLAAQRGRLDVAGYTDAAPYRAGGLSNWTLSTLRADAAREVLVASGFPDPRIDSVSGHGARDLLLPNTPLAAANRRIELILHPDNGQTVREP